jgi:hypothetical protein
MHWVVQSNMFSEEGFNRLLSALTRLKCRFSLVKVVPFSHELFSVAVNDLTHDVPDEVYLENFGLYPELPKDGELAVVMGTYTLCEIARKRGWTPGSFHNDNFDYDLQNYYWPMLNGPGGICRLKDVTRQGVGRASFFIRPVHDSKSFTGQVMDWPKFDEWRTGVLALTAEDQPTVTGDTLCVVAQVREIWREYRLWVVDGQVVTSSLYKFGTLKRYEEGSPPWVLDFARRCISEWTPARAFAMDVAESKDGLKVIEVNNLNAAGFYAGDMQRLVAAIEGMDYQEVE